MESDNIFDLDNQDILVRVVFPRRIKDLGNMNTAANALSRIDYLYRLQKTNILDSPDPIFDSRKNPLRSSKRSQLDHLEVNSPLSVTVETDPTWLIGLAYFVLKNYGTIRGNAIQAYSDFSMISDQVKGMSSDEIEAWQMGTRLFAENLEESAIEHGANVINRVDDARRFLIDDKPGEVDIDVDRI